MYGDKLVTECHASQIQNVSVLRVGCTHDKPLRQLLAHKDAADRQFILSEPVCNRQV